MQDLIKKTTQQIVKDFGLERVEANMTEEALLQLLANQVAYYMEYDLEFLFSSMYRLDISEQKVKEALAPNAIVSPNIAVAKLILERQKKRVQTKHFYKQAPIKDLDEELEY